MAAGLRHRLARAPARLISHAALGAVLAVGAVAGGLALTSGPASVTFAATAGPPGTPSPRFDATIGYDPETRQDVMFGGLNDNGALADSWVWDGSVWRQERSSDSPPGRSDAAMIFDPKLHALVLFGGSSTTVGGDFDDTWLWTGQAWERRTTATVPADGLEQEHLGYDAATGRVVLVGTPGALEYDACSAETWTFDGSDWQLEHPATPLPAAVAAVVDKSRTGHVLAVLSSREAVDNVRGGQSCPVGSPEARALTRSSTWRWTGSTWLQVSAGTEPGDPFAAEYQGNGLQNLQAVAGSSMLAYDIDASLWSWTGSRWAEIPGSQHGPPPTWLPVESVDGAEVMLFGGSKLPNGPNTADTWVWDGARWGLKLTVGRAAPTPSAAPATQDPTVATPAAQSIAAAR